MQSLVLLVSINEHSNTKEEEEEEEELPIQFAVMCTALESLVSGLNTLSQVIRITKIVTYISIPINLTLPHFHIKGVKFRIRPGIGFRTSNQQSLES